MNDIDKQYVHTMRDQAAERIAAAIDNLYAAQRAIRELTYPGTCQDPGWTETGEGAAGMSLLAQTIDMAWALRTITVTIAERNDL